MLLKHTVLLVLLCTMSFFCPMHAQDAAGEQDTEAKDSVARIPFFNRFAFKTNAVDWLAVLPNFGVEFQLTNNPYKLMTIGLNAKWNWSSYHGTTTGRYSPPAVYDIFDIRPEFRYYYRTTKKPSIPIDETRTQIKDLEARLKKLHADMDKASSAAMKEIIAGKIQKAEKDLIKADSLLKTQRRSFKEWFDEDIWTTDRKNPRPWRAHYVGGYANYANYALKFGERGIRARNAFGFGATAGFVLPLHEYKKGAIDIDLGFSVGLLFAKHDAFTHSIDGNYYTRLEVDDKYFSLKSSSNGYRAYPLVSELRVAFVWRHKSMKHEVQIDEKSRKREETQKEYISNFLEDLDMRLPKGIDFKSLRQRDTLSWNKFKENVTDEKDTLTKWVYTNYYLSDENAAKMEKVVVKRYKQIQRDFSEQYIKEKREANKRKPEKKASDQKRDGKRAETPKNKDATVKKDKGKDGKKASEEKVKDKTKLKDESKEKVKNENAPKTEKTKAEKTKAEKPKKEKTK